MQNRTILGIAAAIVLVLLGTVSIMALTHHEWIGSPGYGSSMMNSQQGSQGMMNSQQGSQGMMNNQQGSQGMMNGQQNTGTQGTPVMGVTHMTMQNSMYQYSNIQVRVGTTVTWTNLDIVSHSMTFNNGMKESGLLSQGQSFSATFNTPGTYQYFCTVHPSMVATVTVVS